MIAVLLALLFVLMLALWVSKRTLKKTKIATHSQPNLQSKTKRSMLGSPRKYSKYKYSSRSYSKYK